MKQFFLFLLHFSVFLERVLNERAKRRRLGVLYLYIKSGNLLEALSFSIGLPTAENDDDVNMFVQS